jgi:hypothetical protein
MKIIFAKFWTPRLKYWTGNEMWTISPNRIENRQNSHFLEPLPLLSFKGLLSVAKALIPFPGPHLFVCSLLWFVLLCFTLFCLFSAGDWIQSLTHAGQHVLWAHPQPLSSPEAVRAITLFHLSDSFLFSWCPAYVKKILGPELTTCFWAKSVMWQL